MIPSPQDVSRFPVSKELKSLVEEIENAVSASMYRHESYTNISKDHLAESIADFVLSTLAKKMVSRGWNVTYRSAYDGEIGFCWRIDWTAVPNLRNNLLLG